MVYIPVHTYVYRDDLIQDALAVYKIPLNKMRVHDAQQTNLPGTASSDDLAIIDGTFGTADWSLRTSDSKNTSVTQYARFQFALPPEYDAGETITVRLNAGAVTTVSQTSMTVDVQCYKNGAGSDLCATAATTCNNLTPANKDFTITPTGLAAGDMLDIRIAAAIVDSGTGTAVICEINGVSVLLDIKG